MKKSSVLIQRAALFAAVAVLISIAVGLSVFGALNWWQTDSAVRDQLAPQARLLAATAAEDAAQGSAREKGEVLMFALTGGTAWYTDDAHRTVNLTDQSPFPERLAPRLDAAIDGREQRGSFVAGGVRWLYAKIGRAHV